MLEIKERSLHYMNCDWSFLTCSALSLVDNENFLKTFHCLALFRVEKYFLSFLEESFHNDRSNCINLVLKAETKNIALLDLKTCES